MSANVIVGQQFSIIVTATSNDTVPLTFKWFKDGTQIPAATAASFVAPNAPSTASGVYTVQISNSAGSIVSPKATIAMITPVVITSQPIPAAALTGTTASFAIVATGTGPLTYQWKKDGVAIVGATLPSLSLSAIKASDAGVYTCAVTNLAGTVASSGAGLTVISVTLPVITGFGITSP